MRIITVDPGKVTGIGWWAEGEPVFEMTPRWEAMVNTVAMFRPDVLVIERFTINNRTAQRAPDGLPLRIIGALEWVAWKEEIEVVFQSPSKVMRLVTDDVLRTLGWYTSGPDHARDAARHLAVYALESDDAPALKHHVEEALRASLS